MNYKDTEGKEIKENIFLTWSYKENEEHMEDTLTTKLYEGEMLFIEADESDPTLKYIEAEMKEHGKNGDIQWYNYQELIENPNTQFLIVKAEIQPSREDKIKFCIESNEYFGGVYDLNFSSLTDEKLDECVAFLDYLWEK